MSFIYQLIFAISAYFPFKLITGLILTNVVSHYVTLIQHTQDSEEHRDSETDFNPVE